MLFFATIFCRVFGNCERDEISGMKEIRARNKRFLMENYIDRKYLNPEKEHIRIAMLPRNHADEYRFLIVGKPGSAFGLPVVARFRLSSVPPSYRLE